MDDKNNSGSYELKTINAMNNSKLWVIWTILGYELRVLDVMNN